MRNAFAPIAIAICLASPCFSASTSATWPTSLASPCEPIKSNSGRHISRPITPKPSPSLALTNSHIPLSHAHRKHRHASHDVEAGVTNAELADFADSENKGYGRFSYLPGNTLVQVRSQRGFSWFVKQMYVCVCVHQPRNVDRKCLNLISQNQAVTYIGAAQTASHGSGVNAVVFIPVKLSRSFPPSLPPSLPPSFPTSQLLLGARRD